MKKFLNVDDLRRLIKNIKTEFSKYSKKEEIPTKISDLNDDTTNDKPINYSHNAYFSQFADQSISAGSASEADQATKAYQDANGDVIHETYSTKSEVNTVESIAKGRATGYVFDTVEDMNIWLSGDQDDIPYPNTDMLVLGDNLYIRATDVPDYWWDGSSAQPLETQKVDLTEYVTTEELNIAIGEALEGDY